MTQASKSRRWESDLADGKHSLLPKLALASRQPPPMQPLWLVQDPELARSTSHLRAIARQQQTSKTKPKPTVPAARNEKIVRVSPRLPVASLAPLHHPKWVDIITTNNNNNGEKDPVLQEIWRVASMAAKQQHNKPAQGIPVGSSKSFDNGESSNRRQHHLGNQEEEMPSGSGTTLARYRRLVGVYGRRALMLIIRKAAENVVRRRLEDRCALCIQRVVRCFLGRRRRARLRFRMVDAVERIERQWKRMRARRQAAARRRELLEQRRAKESRLAAARDIQLRYKEFVEAKKRKTQEEEARYKMEQMHQQQLYAERRHAAAWSIQCALRRWRWRESRKAQAQNHAAEPVTGQSVRVDPVVLETADGSHASTGLSQVQQITASSAPGGVGEGQIVVAHPGEESYPTNTTSSLEEAIPERHERTQSLHSPFDCYPGDCDDEARRSAVFIMSGSDGVPELTPTNSLVQHDRLPAYDCTTTQASYLQTREDLHNVSTPVLQVGSYEGSLPNASPDVSELTLRSLETIDTDTVDPPQAVGMVARRCHATAVVERFLVERGLPRARGQLLVRHVAARRIQRLLRHHLACRRVTFQRQLHLLSLRSELQAEWLKCESLLMASILGDDDMPADPEQKDIKDHATLVEEEDASFPSDDEADETVVATGVAWTDVLPTRNGVIPHGIGLDLSNHHGPASSAAPSKGLWKWSWVSQRWESSRKLFDISRQARSPDTQYLR